MHIEIDENGIKEEAEFKDISTPDKVGIVSICLEALRMTPSEAICAIIFQQENKDEFIKNDKERKTK